MFLRVIIVLLCIYQVGCDVTPMEDKKNIKRPIENLIDKIRG